MEIAADWKANAPYVTPTFFVLLGKRPFDFFDLKGVLEAAVDGQSRRFF